MATNVQFLWEIGERLSLKKRTNLYKFNIQVSWIPALLYAVLHLN